jgi:hypothetical protein
MTKQALAAVNRTAASAYRMPRLPRATTSEKSVSSGRHCERSEAIQTISAEAVWIASARCASQ